MWTKKTILKELKRLRKYWHTEEYSLRVTIDYILLHPKSVRRDFFNALMKEDLRGDEVTKS